MELYFLSQYATADDIASAARKSISLQQPTQQTQLDTTTDDAPPPKIGSGALWRIIKWLAKTKVSSKKRSFILLREQMCDIIEEHRAQLSVDVQDFSPTTTSEDTTSRNKLLRESEHFRTAMHEFFESLNLKRMPNFKIKKLTYMQLLLAIYRVLSIQKKVDKSILEFDWKNDAQGQDSMDFELFFRAMLELTECFCNTESEDECVTFIRCLHREVARRAQLDNPRAPFIIFRENDIDRNIRLQMEDMQERMRKLEYSDSNNEENLTAAQQIGFIQYYSGLDDNASGTVEDEAEVDSGGVARRAANQQRPSTNHTERSQLTRAGSVSQRVPVVTTSRRSSQQSQLVAPVAEDRTTKKKKRITRKRSQRKLSAVRKARTQTRPQTTDIQQRTEKRYETLLSSQSASHVTSADFPYNDIARQRRQVQSAVHKERQRIQNNNRNIRHKLQSAQPRYWSAAQSKRPAKENTLEQIIGQRKMRSANETSKSWRNLVSFMEQGLVKPTDL